MKNKFFLNLNFSNFFILLLKNIWDYVNHIFSEYEGKKLF